MVPVQIAELLGWPSVSYARHVELCGGILSIERQSEAGYDDVICPLPAVVTLTAGVVEPRYPTFKGIRAAQSKPIEELSVSGLGLDPRQVGFAGARQQVICAQPVPMRPPGEIVTDTGEAYKCVIAFLERLKVL
jgi:electron transfer flavoprotein beta subunit